MGIRQVAQKHTSRSLVAALGGTLLLRIGGGVMGILTWLFLSAKNGELGPNHPYHITATIAGIIIASFFLTELGGSFVTGSLIDQHGPRRFMIIGPLFGSVAMLAAGLAHLRPESSFSIFLIFIIMLIAARLFEGASSAAANPASLALIAAYTSRNDVLRSRISGYFELVTLMGSVVGYVIGGWLWDHVGQGAFLLNIFIYLLSAAIFLAVDSVKPAKRMAEDGQIRAYLELMGSPRMRDLIPAWLAVSALLGVLFNQVPFQLSALPRHGSESGVSAVPIPFAGQSLSHAFSGSQIGLVFGIYALAFGGGIVLWSLLAPRMRKSSIMLISVGGVIAATVLIGRINHSGSLEHLSMVQMILIALFLIAVMVESGFTPAALIYLSDLSELYPERRGRIMGLYSFLFGLGQLAGAIIAGPFADAQGIDGLLLFMGLLAMLSLVGVIRLRHDEAGVGAAISGVAVEPVDSGSLR